MASPAYCDSKGFVVFDLSCISFGDVIVNNSTDLLAIVLTDPVLYTAI